MHKPKSIKELLNLGTGHLNGLKARSTARGIALDHVRARLTAPLAAAVVSAGIDNDCLTIGVVNANWASRLRYAAARLKVEVGSAMGTDINRVRIKVVPTQT